MENIEVSVVCFTYNHEKYIEKCIKSILEQETNFAYEIIIHDDASTDATTNIVKKYASLYPDKIVAIIQEQNVTSKGKNKLNEFIFPISKGKYIAYCEGDDYWCCKEKLQKQYDGLCNNPHCKIAVHATQCVSEDGKKEQSVFPGVKFQSGIISAQDIINELPTWLFHYSSYFYEKNAYLRIAEEQKEFYSLFPVGDIRYIYLFLLCSDIYYNSEIMSCYRTQAIGSWTTRLTKEKEKIFCERMLAVTMKFISVIKQKRKEISMDYFEQNAVMYYEFRLSLFNKEYKKIVNKKYKKFFCQLPMKFRIKLYMMFVYRILLEKFK